jgi:hypothetical protein
VNKIVDATALWIVEMFIPHGSQDAANLALLKDQLRQLQYPEPIPTEQRGLDGKMYPVDHRAVEMAVVEGIPYSEAIDRVLNGCNAAATITG